MNDREIKRQELLQNPLDLYFEEINKYDVLTKDEEIELARKVKTGDKKARDRFIECNLRLVPYLVHDHRRQHAEWHAGVPLGDLISRANILLMTAVDKFDPERVPYRKFSTYARHWIKAAVRRELTDQNRVVKLPEPLNIDLFNLHKSITDYESRGEEVTLEKLVETVKLSRTKISQEGRARRIKKLLVISEDLGGHLFGTRDLVEYYRDEQLGDSALVHHDVDEDKERVDYQKKILWHAIDTKLSMAEKRTLIQRFGLDGSSAKTLREVGDLHGTTQERVRQRQVEIIRKLKVVLKEYTYESPSENPGVDGSGAL